MDAPACVCACTFVYDFFLMLVVLCIYLVNGDSAVVFVRFNKFWADANPPDVMSFQMIHTNFMSLITNELQEVTLFVFGCVCVRVCVRVCVCVFMYICMYVHVYVCV